MANGEQIRRAYWTYQCIKKGKYPNKSRILEFLEEYDLSPSLKTVERTLEYLRSSLMLAIEYDNKKGGYYFEDDYLKQAGGALRFLEMAYLAENIDRKEYSKYISYGEADLLDGLQHVPLLLEAIDNKQIIQFDHENYQKETIKTTRIAPHLIREYLNRWYVIGYKQDTNELRTFGVDRISNLSLTNVSFEKNDKQSLHSLFEHVIGVVYDADKILKIEFKVPIEQKKYLNSLPLHKSQIHLIDQDGEAHYQIEVVHNYELEQKLLMHSPFLTVTQPQHFVEYFGGKVKAIAKRYK